MPPRNAQTPGPLIERERPPKGPQFVLVIFVFSLWKVLADNWRHRCSRIGETVRSVVRIEASEIKGQPEENAVVPVIVIF